MYRMYPNVFRLQIHLPDRQQVHFRPHEPIANVLERSKKTILTEFFYMNTIDHDARNYLYRESSLSIIVEIIKTKHGHKEDLIKK